MQAKDMFIVDLVGKKDAIFYVPLYQRKYTWEENKQVKQLWEDLNEFMEMDLDDFFLGSLIIKKDNGLNTTHVLIDGQQRITTILLLIAAHAEATNKKTDSEDYVTLKKYLKSDEHKFKLERVNDSDIIKKILNNSHTGFLNLSTEEKESRYYKVYEYFLEKIRKTNDANDEFIGKFLGKVLEKIKVAVINLNSNEDEYSVFESINSKGKGLTSADLIKNYIVMNLESYPDLLKIFENRFISTFKDDEKIIQFYRQIFAIHEGKLYEKNNKSIYYRFKEKYKDKTVNDLTKAINQMCDEKILWDYIYQNKFVFYLHPLMKSNKNNFYAIIHTIIKHNSEVVNGKLIIINQKNIDWSLKYMASLVVGRTLVSFRRVEGNRTYAEIAHKLEKSIFELNDFKKAFEKEVITYLCESNSNYRMPKWDEISDIEAKRDLYSELKGTLKFILISIEEYQNC